MKAERASLGDFDLPAGKDQYPLDFSQENRAVKLSETPDEVTVGLCDPQNASVLSTLRLFHRKKLRVLAIDPSEFASWLGKLRGRSGMDAAIAGDDDPSVALDRIANDAPIVNYVNGLIIDAVRARASDIHVECFEEEALVRYRVDGVLSIADRFPKDRFAAVSIRLKLMANLNIMEKRLPQDGRIMADLGKDRVELRVSFVPIARGESIVLRLLGGTSSPRQLSALGMEGKDLARINRLLAFPHGLVIVSGPTGSGKTTTLSSMLRELPAESLKIISIEDPIEYLIPGSCQIQVNEAIGLSFESVLRRVLRQDPSVVMVGEIRDADTAELSVRASLTGHLVLSSLHTNDSVSCVSRLRDLGVEPYLISSTLRAVIAQRLVRRVCPSCAATIKADAEEKRAAAAHGIDLSTIKKAKGCPECRGTGFSGRAAVVEIFPVDEDIAELIAAESPLRALRAKATEKGMRSLAQAGLSLVREGLTTLEELRREVEL